LSRHITRWKRRPGCIGWPVEMGIMIEVPAAALISSRLAPHVDFFSIGTNDLTQYTLAAERGNPDLANLANALRPGCPAPGQAGRRCGAPAWQVGGVCGEIAATHRLYRCWWDWA